MSIRLSRAPWFGVMTCLVIGGAGVQASRADFVISGGFGPNGDVGFANSPAALGITFGTNGLGSIYQLDGFVNVPGRNLENTGSGFGTSADLSYGAPTGISYAFNAALLNAHQLVLTYQFTNQTGISLPGFQFLSYIDANIGSDPTNETVSITGSRSQGLPNRSPTSFQVGDPSTSSLFTNQLFGTLNNVNDFPAGQPGDVAMGIGFSIGVVSAGQLIQFQVTLSDNLTSVGSLNLTQRDPLSSDTLTYSGLITVVPEPATWLLFTLGGVIVLSARGVRVRRSAIKLESTGSRRPAVQR